MRTQSNEHRDSLPNIDISLLKHAAYVFDGIVFYLRCNLYNANGSFSIQNEFDALENGSETDENEETLDDCQFFHKLESDQVNNELYENLMEDTDSMDGVRILNLNNSMGLCEQKNNLTGST